MAQGRFAGFKRATFGFPFGDAAIKDCHIMCAKQGQHPPGAGGRLERAVIIHHDAAAVPKSERLHTAREFFGRRQCVRQAAIGVGKFFQIHEHGRWDMPAFIFCLRIAARIGHEPCCIDHAKVGRADLVRQPIGAY